MRVTLIKSVMDQSHGNRTQNFSFKVELPFPPFPGLEILLPRRNPASSDGPEKVRSVTVSHNRPDHIVCWCLPISTYDLGMFEAAVSAIKKDGWEKVDYA